MSLVLTKYQVSKIIELMCPLCNGDLDGDKLTKRCQSCGMVYQGEIHVDA